MLSPDYCCYIDGENKMEKLLKTGLSVRSDYYYCPLAFQLNTYWNCENSCSHCFLRRLNRTWGTDLRPLDVDLLLDVVKRGIVNENPRSPLAVALAKRKTIYVGSKSDPYQPAEMQYGVTRKALRILLHYGFSIVIATKFTLNLERDRNIFEKYKPQVTIMPIVSPGINKDWADLEHRGTTHPLIRIEHAKKWQNWGFNVGINGEPYIPGYHTLEDFQHVCRLLSDAGIKSYNTYNLHMNDWNAKQMHAAGLDIERIWHANQDNVWRGILLNLIKIAKGYKIELGCPDFVNSGEYQETANTCCGINVPNPCTFNVINWKKIKQKGISDERILKRTWDGVGSLEYGQRLLAGELKNVYSLKDIVY
jgi:DNA repair photolyase